jgi:hypothetical protein
LAFRSDTLRPFVGAPPQPVRAVHYSRGDSAQYPGECHTGPLGCCTPCPRPRSCKPRLPTELPLALRGRRRCVIAVGPAILGRAGRRLRARTAGAIRAVASRDWESGTPLDRSGRRWGLKDRELVSHDPKPEQRPTCETLPRPQRVGPTGHNANHGPRPWHARVPDENPVEISNAGLCHSCVLRSVHAQRIHTGPGPTAYAPPGLRYHRPRPCMVRRSPSILALWAQRSPRPLLVVN